jgi:hypothetical protein
MYPKDSGAGDAITQGKFNLVFSHYARKVSLVFSLVLFRV